MRQRRPTPVLECKLTQAQFDNTSAWMKGEDEKGPYVLIKNGYGQYVRAKVTIIKPPTRRRRK